MLARHYHTILGSGAQLREGKGFMAPPSPGLKTGLYLTFVGSWEMFIIQH